MTWHPSTSCGYESAKIGPIAVPYLQGRALDIGCGTRKVWPSLIGVDNFETFGPGTAAGINADMADLSMFAAESCDAVFSSHALEDIEPSKAPAVLAEWARVLKVGGYLVLYVPSANFYPKMGEEGANPAHKMDIYAGDVERMLLKGTACGWTQVECEERSGTNEYSWFEVYQKRADGEYVKRLYQRNPDGKKRCLVCRFGAIGDQLVAASVLPLLKKQGYHITWMTTPDSYEIIKNDPHIDEFWTQARDFVPNHELGAFWSSIEERFDRFINLSESIEGALLQLPGRLTHAYPDDVRRKLFGSVNYLERTHDIAGVEYDFSVHFYPTKEETAWAGAVRRQMNGPVVAWAISGSSIHKVYPYTQVVVRWLLDNTASHVVILGDLKDGKKLQDAIVEALDGKFPEERLHLMAGIWEIRKVLSFVQQADIVVGPETGVLNSVSMEEDVAKVVYLSHSSRENLTKHWRNTKVLVPSTDDCPCYPCHRLHYDGTYCHQDETKQVAKCAASIRPEIIMKAIAACAEAAA